MAINATDWAELPLNDKITLLSKCNGEHIDLDDLFTCDSCNVLFNELTN